MTLKKLKNGGVLTNIFSREKSLLYFCVWDESDRRGIEFIGEQVRNSLFIVPPQGQKGSVWYEKSELEYLKARLIKEVRHSGDNKTWQKISNISEEGWRFVEAYAKGERGIKSADEFEDYYDHLVNFWVCLNSFIYEISDSETIDKGIRNWLGDFRKKTEKHTEKLSSLLTDFLRTQSTLKELVHFITKDEAVALLHGKMGDVDRLEITNRGKGCFMFNGTIYLLDQLDDVLSEHNLSLENFSANATEIKGSSAFSGVVKGNVKVVEGFNDLNKITAGDILVTQMTSPKYLGIMTKVGGIVTDQGGTLCHAAITARELKIPCVIGTKIATQVLRDGDLVEVDADRGIVRKL